MIVKRKLYLKEEQREYGLKRSILKGIIKSKNKYDEIYSKSIFGKNKINELENSIEKSISKKAKLEKDIDKLDKNSILKNSTVESNLKKKIPERTYFIDAEGSGRNHNKNLRNPKEKDDYRKHLKFLGSKDKANFENSDDSILFDRKSGGNASLSHEIGHVINRRSTGKQSDVDKIVDKSILKYNNIVDNPRKDIETKTGLFPSSRRSKYIGKSIIKNEENATKTGLELLKDSGASDKEIKAAKEVLDKSIKHYKEGEKIYKDRSKISRIKSFRDKK
jgi:hypothetical protein